MSFNFLCRKWNPREEDGFLFPLLGSSFPCMFYFLCRFYMESIITGNYWTCFLIFAYSQMEARVPFAPRPPAGANRRSQFFGGIQFASTTWSLHDPVKQWGYIDPFCLVMADHLLRVRTPSTQERAPFVKSPAQKGCGRWVLDR